MVESINSELHLSNILKSNNLVIIDCYATWCGPCKQIAPTIARLANIYPDWKFCKLDVDKVDTLAQKLQVSAMPTFIFIVNAQQKYRVQGADEKAIIKYLDNY